MKHYFLSLLVCFLYVKENILAGAIPVNSKDKGSSQNVALVNGTIASTMAPVTTVPEQITPNSFLEKGIGCGMRHVKANSVLQITSTNFPRNYFNRDGCDWKFLASGDCTLTTTCPCFDMPSSFNCLGDYLKISDGSHYTQKFCGDNKPFGKYRSGSNELSIKWKSNSRETAQGFICYILCTPPQFADQQTPDQLPDGNPNKQSCIAPPLM